MTADENSVYESDFAQNGYDDDHLTPKQKRAFVQLLSKYIRCVCMCMRCVWVSEWASKQSAIYASLQKWRQIMNISERDVPIYCRDFNEFSLLRFFYSIRSQRDIVAKNADDVLFDMFRNESTNLLPIGKFLAVSNWHWTVHVIEMGRYNWIISDL